MVKKKNSNALKDYDLADIYLWIVRGLDWNEIQKSYIIMNGIDADINNTDDVRDYDELSVELMKELFLLIVQSLETYDSDAERILINNSKNFVVMFDLYDDRDEITCIYCPDAFHTRIRISVPDDNVPDRRNKLFSAIRNSEKNRSMLNVYNMYNVCDKMNYCYDSRDAMIHGLTDCMVGAFDASKESEYGGFCACGRFIVRYDKIEDMFDIIFTIEEETTPLTVSSNTTINLQLN